MTSDRVPVPIERMDDQPIVFKRSEPLYNSNKPNQVMWRRSKNRSFVFSRKMIENFTHRTGLHPKEAERMMKIAGEEFYKLLLAGNGVCLPGCPVMYLDYQRVTLNSFAARGVYGTFTTRVRTSQKHRDDIRKYGVNRGSFEQRFIAEKCRINGIPMTRVKLGVTAKGQDSSTFRCDVIHDVKDVNGNIVKTTVTDIRSSDKSNTFMVRGPLKRTRDGTMNRSAEGECDRTKPHPDFVRKRDEE